LNDNVGNKHHKEYSYMIVTRYLKLASTLNYISCSFELLNRNVAVPVKKYSLNS